MGTSVVSARQAKRAPAVSTGLPDGAGDEGLELLPSEGPGAGDDEDPGGEGGGGGLRLSQYGGGGGAERPGG